MTLDPSSIRWHSAPWRLLEAELAYRVLAARAAVFVVEQNCVYLDLDGKDLDPDCLHLVATTGGRVLAYLRVVPPGISFVEPSIGRVLTSSAARGSGLGHDLIARGIELCSRQWPDQPIRIGAQSHLQAFYAAHGFVPASEPYLEDDIPHIEMLRQPSRESPATASAAS